ncbi:MAG: hypothetical protein ABSC94_19355 [Polyangiaceae bacterium]
MRVIRPVARQLLVLALVGLAFVGSAGCNDDNVLGVIVTDAGPLGGDASELRVDANLFDTEGGAISADAGMSFTGTLDDDAAVTGVLP